MSELSNCDPIIYVEDLWSLQKFSLTEQAKPAADRRPMDASDPAIPCGLVAKSVFNDTFELWKEAQGSDPATRIEIEETGIAWSSDITYKFKNTEMPPGDTRTWQDVQWLDMTTEHFIVWMRTAGLPNFRKLWGRIDSGLDPGRYILQIDNQYQVKPFQGSKSFVLSTTNALGGKNYFLAVCYITVGTLCMLFAFVFCVAYMRKKSNNNNASSNNNI